MLARILEIDSAAGIVRADLAGAAAVWVRPVHQIARLDSGEALLEFDVAGQKGIVLQGNIAFRVNEVQGDIVVQPYGKKQPNGHGRGTSEDLAEEVGGHLLVMRKDEGVVELDGHVALDDPQRMCS